MRLSRPVSSHRIFVPTFSSSLGDPWRCRLGKAWNTLPRPSFICIHPLSWKHTCQKEDQSQYKEIVTTAWWRDTRVRIPIGDGETPSSTWGGPASLRPSLQALRIYQNSSPNPSRKNSTDWLFIVCTSKQDSKSLPAPEEVQKGHWDLVVPSNQETHLLGGTV